MSWDSYVDNLKVPGDQGECVIQEAAIWGCLPGEESPWTTVTQSFPITADEIKILAGNRSGFQGSGPCVGGIKCMVLSDHMDEDTSYCLNMKTKQDANKKSYAMIVGRTNKTLIIAKGGETAHAGTVTQRVYKTVSYLRERNY